MSLAFRTLLVLTAAVVAVFAASSAASARTDAGRTLTAQNALEVGVLGEINALRRSRGLRPLRMSAALTRPAHTHSTAMATAGFFSHNSVDGTSFWKRVQRYYPRRSGTWSVGENLLWSSPSIGAAGALRMWLNSPPHRKILLTARWREVGLSAVHVSSAGGVYGGCEVTVLTADFGVR